MSVLRIHCDGGLGNRLGVLIGGLLAARRIGSRPVVHWPANDNCGARLDDLYESIPAQLDDGPPDPGWPLLSHMDWAGRQCLRHTPDNLDRLRGIDAEYTHHHLHWGSEREATGMLRAFVVRREIESAVDAFCAEHGIDRSVVGIHLRETDNPSEQHRSAARARIQREWQRRFLVVSDDPDTEAAFGLFHNVTVRPKRHRVDKIQPGGWRIPPPPDDPTRCYNVRRSREQVIEALEDMRILARTDLTCSRSTFCTWARLQ